MALAKDILNTFLTWVNQSSVSDTPASGRSLLYFKTDGNLYKKDSGGTESRVGGDSGVPWYGNATITAPPAVSGFTWVNQGSATATEANSTIELYGPTSAGTDLHILKKSKTGTYTITMLMKYSLLSNWIQTGFVWRESSSGKLVTYGPNYDNGLLLPVCKWNSATSVLSYYTAPAMPTGYPFWFRIQVDSTNRICSYSVDGKYFANVHSVSKTDYITADEVGFYIGQQSNSSQQGTSLIISWLEGA